MEEDPKITYNLKAPREVFICYEQMSGGQHLLTILVPEVIVRWLHNNLDMAIFLKPQTSHFMTYHPMTKGHWSNTELMVVAQDARPIRKWYIEYQLEGYLMDNLSDVLVHYKKLLQDFATGLSSFKS